MKIWASNELILTVLLGKEKASKHMKGIFEKYYGDIDKAFAGVEPEIISNKGTNETSIKWE